MAKGNVYVPSKFAKAPEWFGLNKETLDFIKTLPKRQRPGALRKLGEVEWSKCRDDIHYWLDPSQHMPTEKWPNGVPYVFTHDPHQRFKCIICPEDNDEYYTFDKLKQHLELIHNIEERDPLKVRARFHEVPSIRPFPYHLPYIKPIIHYWLQEPLLLIEKSRDMVATWTIVMLYTWDTLFHEGAQNIFQSLTGAKACDLVRRANAIYKNQPEFLQNVHKANFSMGLTKSGELVVPSLNSVIMGFAQDPDQVRQFHPRGLFQDEAAFLPKAGDCFAAAKPTIQNGGRFTAISSASPGWFQLCCEDRLEEYQE